MKLKMALILIFALNMPLFSWAQNKSCNTLFYKEKNALRYQKTRPEIQTLRFDMPGMKTASISDPTLSTGVTLFLFPKGSTANFDARGGSVASIETELLQEGSYSNEIDAVLFAGGSTMGLEATQGVRRRIFKERSQDASDFDFIPAVPGAVVYDYGGRIEPTQDALTYPNMIMGAKAFDFAQPNTFTMGRVGAGTTTTANKISVPIWGGQGAAYKKVDLQGIGEIRVFTAVVLNPSGNILMDNSKMIDPELLSQLRKQSIPRGPRQNTTLSLVVTDVVLDRSQLKRLATVVHTNMARQISPFHTYTDGDILFVVSTNKTKIPERLQLPFEEYLQNLSSESMSEAISKSILISNGVEGD